MTHAYFLRDVPKKSRQNPVQLIGTGRGIAYLHAQEIVHGDIRGVRMAGSANY
jgi:tRNA A-37 threonylcarbamoyl transferase component Bud32